MDADGRLTLGEAAARAGLATDAVERVLVAAGITIADPDVAFIDETLFGALSAFQMAASVFGESATLQFSRVLGAAAARLADAAVGLFVSEVQSSAADDLDTSAVAQLVTGQIPAGFAAILPRHMAMAVARDRVARRPGSFDTVDVAVGFVDVVGSTEWAQELTPTVHADALLGFESAAWDAAMKHGGRVVKLLGDEAMFVAAEVPSLCHMAMDLCEAVSRDPRLPPARGAVGKGEVAARDGDYFGPLVNLVSRCVKAAPSGQVVVVQEASGDLDPPGWVLTPLAPRPLRGIQAPVTLWAVSRSGL